MIGTLPSGDHAEAEISTDISASVTDALIHTVLSEDLL
jgi:hypothetical protein